MNAMHAGMSYRDWIWKLYEDGHLGFAVEGVRPKGLVKHEVAAIEATGILIGMNGWATLFAHCPKCSWDSHAHFEIGDLEREDARADLMESHAKDMHGKCDNTDLMFREECVPIKKE